LVAGQFWKGQSFNLKNPKVQMHATTCSTLKRAPKLPLHPKFGTQKNEKPIVSAEIHSQQVKMALTGLHGEIPVELAQ